MIINKFCEYFNETDPFFKEQFFRDSLDWAIQKDKKVIVLLNSIYSRFVNKPNCLLLPYGVIKMVYFEFFPAIGEEYIKYRKVNKYLSKLK